ncbi:efflux RND transporter permease subunit [Shewanella sp. GXUN23E]|uniref:efflux RND transporter permease subunit n=1 Tax=Shewanella sp. GXUN23E TaxID=3422498 RepID=UPI003D7C8AC5
MSLTKLAIKRPVTTSMFFLAIVLFGMVASRLLPLELFPGIDIPQVFIEAPYPGSTPSEVEREVTEVLEEALATMGGIDEMRSNSSQSGASVQLRMKWGENVATKALEAREKIDTVRHLLPDDLERVFIRQFSTSDMPIMTLRLSSERELSGAFDLLDKQLKKPLERVSGVSQVTLYGVDKKQIEIRVDANKLAASGISAPELNSLMHKANFIVSGGTLRARAPGASEGIVYQVSPKGEYRSIEEVAAQVLRPGLELKDIASVTFALPEAIEGRHLDRKYAVGLDVFKESGANLVEVSERVMKVVEEIKQDPQFTGIRLYVMDNSADGVKSSLKDLLAAGLMGALMSFAVLYLFLRDMRMTLVVVSSVPIAISMTLAAMYFLGYSLNVLSMMGLLLAIGMLIDNAVVVTESVLQEKQTPHSHDAQGEQDAVVRGVDKVSLAVLAGTLTTAIVFLPNIFGVKVQLTIFLEHVAIAICISLLASLLVAKTLIPLMLSKLNIQPKASAQHPQLTAFYRKTLGWVLYHPRWSTLIAVVILASTALPLSMVKDDQNEGQSDNRLFINYQIEGRHTVATTEAMIDRMEAYLYANKEAFFIDSVYSYYSPDRGQSTLILQKDLPIPTEELKEKIRAGFPKFAYAKPQFGWGNEDNGVRVTLIGRSTSELIRISEQVMPLLSAIDGMEDVRSEYNGGQQEVIVRLDPELASRLGIDTRTLASSISLALRGNALRSFRHDPNGELRIELGYDKHWQSSLEQLKALPVVRMDNRVYSLESLAQISIQPRFDTIRHYDRQTSLQIGANLNELTTEEAREQITNVMDAVAFPPGYRYSLTGGFQRQDREQQIMVTNMLLAVAMIYIVMAALFESLLLPSAIITSIVFAITGVFWALLFTGTPMDMMAMIGILILMGVVVNNGIVLVDQINQMTPELDKLADTILEVCLTRLRPVLMTVGTTVLGLVPLAMGDTQIGGGGPPYAPMAIAIIGGLTFSTVTSLYLVPLCYQGLFHMRHASAVRLGQAERFSRRALPWIR